MPLAACPGRDDLLAYTRGDLPNTALPALDAHLDAGCPHCEETLAHLERQEYPDFGLLRDHPPEFLKQNTSLSGPAVSSAIEAGPHLGKLLANKYQLLETIGEGAMGVVTRALDVMTNRVVAIKQIRGGGAAPTLLRKRFEQEARSLACLEHPNIVRLHEYGEDDGQPFFALEFVDGQSLDRRLRTALLSPQESARLCRTLAQTVQFAHAHGVIHRDLKPANVLLDRDETPKITDFGLAKQVEVEEGQTRTGFLMGTGSYMPPEQARGEARDLTFQADVYSLGATLYEMLTGRPPFLGPILHVLEQIQNREPTPPSRVQPNVPRDLETICLKCLEKDA